MGKSEFLLHKNIIQSWLTILIEGEKPGENIHLENMHLEDVSQQIY